VKRSHTEQAIAPEKKGHEGMGLLTYKPAVHAPIEAKILAVIHHANTKFPLDPKNAMNYLNNAITNQNERIDIMAYETIYYYYPNADMEDSFDI
jgi:hypothetical protein